MVFSDFPVIRVTISGNDGEPVEARKADTGLLAELAWNVTKYATAQHKLSVSALDQSCSLIHLKQNK